MLAGYNIKNFNSATLKQGIYYNFDARLLDDINKALNNQSSPIKKDMLIVYLTDKHTIAAIDLRGTPFADFSR